VVEAIRTRDADAAENAMGELIGFVQSDVERFLQRNDLEAELDEGDRGAVTGTTALRLIQGTTPAAEQRKNNL
jgi:hypothetical protein